MGKEPLSLITVKTLLAVIIFTGIGTIIIGGGYLIADYYKNRVDNNSSLTDLFKKKEILVTTDKIEYERGEIVKIAVKNINRKERCVDHDFTVEMFEKDSWVRVKRIWCPCEAVCNLLPPCSKILQPGETLEYQWEQKESWCSGHQGHSETITNQASVGIYRIVISTNKGEIYSNEFTIKEKSALDPRCSEKVKIIGPCETTIYDRGYEFDIELGRCIEKNVAGSGCKTESPFKTLEECQRVCEEKMEEILTPDYVLSHSDELINKTIKITGVANAGFPSICTEMFCGPDKCCNDCSGPLLLTEKGLKKGDKGYAEIILSGGSCFGNECVLDKCYPLEKGRIYVVTGIWNGKSLVLNEEILFKSAF